jgi:hypothetical protein
MKPQDVKKILECNLSTMTKREINESRQKLLQAIKWWEVTPLYELRIIGLFGMFQSMIDKEKEMLAALKK